MSTAAPHLVGKLLLLGVLGTKGGLKALLRGFEPQLLNKTAVTLRKSCTCSLPQFLPLLHGKISIFLCSLCKVQADGQRLGVGN